MARDSFFSMENLKHFSVENLKHFSVENLKHVFLISSAARMGRVDGPSPIGHFI
jgi:hypothetical protein